MMQIKELLHFQRDHKGQFVPKLVKIIDTNDKELDTEIFIIPLNRGELIRYFAKFDENNDIWTTADDWVILNKVISPRFTKNDLVNMKYSEQSKYIRTVLHYSGVKFKKQSNDLDEFAKNLKDVRAKKQESRLIYFLNERGYSLTSKDNNLNLLTIPEVDILVEGFKEANPPAKKNKIKKK